MCAQIHRYCMATRVHPTDHVDKHQNLILFLLRLLVAREARGASLAEDRSEAKRALRGREADVPHDATVEVGARPRRAEIEGVVKVRRELREPEDATGGLREYDRFGRISAPFPPRTSWRSPQAALKFSYRSDKGTRD